MRWTVLAVTVGGLAANAQVPRNGGERMQDRQEVRQDHQEVRQDRHQARDDRMDLEELRNLEERYSSARSRNNMPALRLMDNEWLAMLDAEIRESQRELHQDRREVHRDNREIRSDYRQAGYPNDRRETRDDFRDRRDDVKDARRERWNLERLLGIRDEVSRLRGRIDPMSLNRKSQLFQELLAMGRAELRQDHHEMREDHREMREDRREMRDDRR